MLPNCQDVWERVAVNDPPEERSVEVWPFSLATASGRRLISRRLLGRPLRGKRGKKLGCVSTCGARLKDSRKEKRLVGTKLYNIIIHHLFFLTKAERSMLHQNVGILFGMCMIIDNISDNCSCIATLTASPVLQQRICSGGRKSSKTFTVASYTGVEAFYG